MNLKILFLIQAFIISFFLVSLYVIVLKIEAIEERRYNKSYDKLKYSYFEEDEQNETGIIRNQYIVVLRENATFIDEFTKINWIKKAFDENNESYSKIIHYYSLPESIAWNTPSESMNILKENGNENIETFKGFAAKLSPDMYEYFVRHPSVKFVENDEYITLDDVVEKSENDKRMDSNNSEIINNNNNNNEISGSSIVYKIKSNWNLGRLVNRKRLNINSYYYKFGYESAYDVYVYVVDTGVNADHSSFIDNLGYDTEGKNRVTIGKNYITNENDKDMNGHGTHVAGIIGSTTWGVAKRVNIVSVKTMNQKGSGKWSDILAAIEWCLSHLKKTSSKKGIINISLSGEVKESSNSAIKAAISQGIHFAVAGGNNGKVACDYSPASASTYGAVAVGAIDYNDGYAKFSNYGKCITVYAPGYKISSASNTSNSGSKEMTGTSMAAPHVAGIMALMLSAKNMSPKELYKEIVNQASSGYIKNLDGDSPNLIAYVPRYAMVSRCNPLDPLDCVETSQVSDNDNTESQSNFNNNFLVIQ